MLVQARFLWHFPYMERPQGALNGVPRGSVGPPGPLGIAAVVGARVWVLQCADLVLRVPYSYGRLLNMGKLGHFKAI